MKGLVLLLFFSFCCSSWARFSSRHLVIHKKGRKSAKPWRIAQSSESNHFLKSEGWMNDGKSRPLKVHSSRTWTTRLVDTAICFSVRTFPPTRFVFDLAAKFLPPIIPVILYKDIFDLSSSVYFLNRIGREVETDFGLGLFVATYLASGLAGNLLNAYARIGKKEARKVIFGGSGAVVGIIAAYATFLKRNDWVHTRADSQQEKGFVRGLIQD
eukprot:scaffold3405_cov167-Amphora_coffeaeformis.AAC.5